MKQRPSYEGFYTPETREYSTYVKQKLSNCKKNTCQGKEVKETDKHKFYGFSWFRRKKVHSTKNNDDYCAHLGDTTK